MITTLLRLVPQTRIINNYPRCSLRNARIVSGLRSFQLDSSNPFVEKYREKLRQKAGQSNPPLISSGLQDIRLGASSVEELREIYHKQQRPQSELCQKPEPQKELPSDTPISTGPAEASPARSPGPRFAPLKTLSSYIDVEKISLRDVKEIELIWSARNNSDPACLYATIPCQVYQRMHQTARSNPMFVLPLPRGESGVEMHLLQWAFPESNISYVMITSLGEYKLKGEYSRPHTVLSHFSDLSQNKAIVLMRGEIENNRISFDDATLLAMSLQKFYAAKDTEDYGKRKQDMINSFTRGDGFDISSLIEETDRL
ncbi:Protein atp11, mitochondrial [Neolecta irregularis DAH-3]|uniref:Protein atp11, mitochondrial n=1 Tax=Neolecta irregularis (strain DAH-3) TaxID=1198029 RepID=A0A1U7LW13_NEOID|nr:Protein atp11, mitochondrial [Neolecta irregularis DAH-3]|eukprot:OLL26857.1 Protein atp11, mitochondrial [Neolecta irregularis DAH-3]